MKENLAIILNIQSNRNPVLIYCLKELGSLYNITVISPDIFEDGSRFSEVNFLNAFPAMKWGGRFLRVIHIVINLLSLAVELPVRAFKPKFQFSILKNIEAVFNFTFIHRLLLPLFYTVLLLRVKKLSRIISIDAGATTAARWTKRIKKTPFIYWTYEIFPNQFTETPKLLSRTMEKVEADGCKKADVVIVNSAIWAKFLRRRYKIRSLKYKIVCVCPQPVKKYAQLELSDRMKFYYHGAYIKGRGLENLIAAMQHVEGAVLYLRGIGKDLENILKLKTETLNLQDKIKFLPPVPTEQLAEEATNFDIGVMMVCMTTLNAKFLMGFKTFENIAAGLPLFSPPSFLLKEIVRKNEVGIVYLDCSELSLANALNYCVSHKEKVYKWKINARKYAEREANPTYQRRQLLEAVAIETESDFIKE